MNRHERRAMASMSRDLVKTRPSVLTIVPKEEWNMVTDPLPIQVWVSNRYLVQIFDEINVINPGKCHRLSINRVTRNNQDRWVDGITWDELQQVKKDVGYADWYGIECYPRDSDVINVANIRHLWMFEVPLPIGWFRR